MPLTEERRKQLDGIVEQMEANQEAEGDIRFVVEDFKGKYANEKPEGPSITQSVFPSTTRSLERPQMVGFGERLGLDLLSDITSTPTRALGAVTSEQKFSDPETYGGRGFVEQVKPAAKAMYGVPEGVTEFVGRVATDPVSYAGGLLKPAVSAVTGAGKAATAVRSGSSRLAQELSGVSKEALEMGSTKAGRQQLRQASGKQAEIGQKVSDAVGDFHAYLPEREIVEGALKEMPPVDISGIIETLEKAKIKPLTGGAILPPQRAANQQIDAIIRGLRGNARPGQMPKTKLTAEEAYQLRRELDYGLDFDKPETKYVERALKDARTRLKNDLLASAAKSGNKEYALAMKDWSRKLGLLEKIQQRLGTTKNTREARAEAFVNNLFGRNSENKRQLMKELDEVFGTDFLNESKMTFLAKELGDEGKAAILPRQSTGRSTLAAAGGTLAGTMGGGPVVGGLVGGTLAAHASPAVATRAIMPATRWVDDAINQGLLKSPKAQALGRAYQKATSAALKARIATQIQKELEKENQE